MQAAPLIFVVDDDAAVLNSLGFMLEAEGFEVRAFGDIGELLAAESMTKADCLILDYRMPVMNAFDVLSWLREKKVAAPAILITAHHDVKLFDRAFEAGFARVIEKPLLGNRLVENIRELVQVA